MTKDEIIEEWCFEDLEKQKAACAKRDWPFWAATEETAYEFGYETGAKRMYDARQKELDTVKAVSQQEIDEANRWWAERWQKINFAKNNLDYRGFNDVFDEMDAAASLALGKGPNEVGKG